MYNNCMSDYIARPLAESILHARRKAVILEGARAVGKTMMAQRQLVGVGFSYETLADANAYELAKTDLHGWLESLNLPVIIDEAQRIRDLPLAVKEIVDALPAGHTQFILTGSALINRGGLDGQDPLARRAQHFTMSPLTQREMHGVDTSLVDDLWDGEPDVSFDEPIARQKLYDLMAAGGFPNTRRNMPNMRIGNEKDLWRMTSVPCSATPFCPMRNLTRPSPKIYSRGFCACPEAF